MTFLLLCLYVTVLMVRPQEWWSPLAGYELVNVAAILTIFATFISQTGKQNPVHVLTRNTIAKLMFGLLVAVVLSQLVRLRIQGAVDAFTTFGKMVVLFSLTMIIVDTPLRLRRIMWVIIFCATLLSISAILQVWQGRGFGGVTPFGSFETGDFRVQGTGIFGDPNDFAMLYLMATPFVFSLLQSKSNFISKGFLVLTLPAFLYTLYYTQSRGAVAGFCVSLIAYMWVGRRVSIVRLLLILALLAAAVAFGPTRAHESLYEGSAAGRVMEWGAGNIYLKQSPLFGLGFMRWGEFETTSPHNSFVECYAELGLVGYFFWFALCWLVVLSLRRLLKLKNELGVGVIILARGLFAGLVGYLVSAFFLTHTYHPPLYFMEGMGVGLVSFARKQPNVPPDALAITARDLRWCAILEVMSVPAIWLIAKLYWAGGGGG